MKMEPKEDKLQDYIFLIASKLSKRIENTLTIYERYIHITQQNKGDVPKGLIMEPPVRALDQIVDKQFDAVIGIAQAMGLNKITWLNKKLKIETSAPENWVNIFKSLILLTNNGSGLFIAEPGLWTTTAGQNFLKLLEKHGYFLNGLFELPVGSLLHTSLRPYFYVFSRKKKDKLFIAELSYESNIDSIIKNYEQNKSANSIKDGTLINRNEFKSFQNYRVTSQFLILAEHYKNFEKVLFKDLVVKVKTTDFSNDSDSVYIRMAGNFKAIKYEEITKNKYIQLVLDSQKVNASYLYYFLNTDLGQMFLNSFARGSYIPYLSTQDLLEAKLYLLPLGLQNNSIKAISGINNIVTKLKGFESQILYNPTSVSQVEEDLNELGRSLTLLSKEDELLSRIRKGEDLHTEFKSSLRWDINKNEVNKALEHEVLKTLCGFMNTSGGTLFIGVGDAGNIIGMDTHVFTSKDKYLLHFRNLVKDQIGARYYPLIEYEITTLLKQEILVARVQKSIDPVYLGKDGLFYVRTNPSTDELKGKELVEYIGNHFKK